MQEDIRKAGLTLTTGGVASIFLQHWVNLKLASWLTMLGLLIWFIGLIKNKNNTIKRK